MITETKGKVAPTRWFQEFSTWARKSEVWRKVPLEGLHPQQYDFTNENNVIRIDAKGNPEDAFDVYTIMGGGAEELQEARNLPAEMREFLQTQLSKQAEIATKDKDFFFYQNLVECPRQVLVVVKKNLDVPLVIRHLRSSGNLGYMGRVYVYVAEGVRCELVEEYGADSQLPGHKSSTGIGDDTDSADKMMYYNSYSVFHCAKNAHVEYFCMRDFPADVYHLQRFFFSLEEQAGMKACYGHVGGFVGKTYVHVACTGRKANFRGLGAGVHVGREFHDFEVMVENNASDVSSIIIYKMVLRDKAHSIFNGNLNIPSGFKKVRSLQTNHNILLNRTARAESNPRLTIASDDVSCDHGATVGQLNEEALFYLMSRGMTREDAYYLMVEGFLNAVVEEFPMKEHHESLMQIFREKIGSKLIA